MIVELRHSLDLYCDHPLCDRVEGPANLPFRWPDEYTGRSEAACWRRARQDGWRRRKGQVICPHCWQMGRTFRMIVSRGSTRKSTSTLQIEAACQAGLRDVEVARQFGLSRERIRQIRVEAGIGRTILPKKPRITAHNFRGHFKFCVLAWLRSIGCRYCPQCRTVSDASNWYARICRSCSASKQRAYYRSGKLKQKIRRYQVMARLKRMPGIYLSVRKVNAWLREVGAVYCPGCHGAVARKVGSRRLECGRRHGGASEDPPELGNAMERNSDLLNGAAACGSTELYRTGRQNSARPE